MRYKKLIISLSLLSSMLLNYELVTGAPSSEGVSKGSISFNPSNDSTKPVNPEDPSIPEDPNNPAEPLPNPENPDNPNRPTDNLGPLSLDVVPGTMNFGLFEVNLEENSYHPVTNKDALHYIQITDNRGPGIKGWNVSISRTEFKDGDNILGSQLMLPANRVVRNSYIVPASSPAPDFISSSNRFEIPIGSNNALTVLSTGNSSENSHGKGHTTYTWKAEDEELIVGRGQAKSGNFTSTITWSLNATPNY